MNTLKKGQFIYFIQHINDFYFQFLNNSVIKISDKVKKYNGITIIYTYTIDPGNNCKLYSTKFTLPP